MISSMVFVSVEQTLAMEARFSYCKFGMLDIGNSVGLNDERRGVLAIVMFVSLSSF